MNYTIRPAGEVDFVKAPTIALAGETGSGKTESAMRLARGYVGPNGKFAVIDTEEKRALYKKNRFNFDWLDLQPPFTPANYAGALESVKGYQAVIVDSASHEWAGEGGMQDMHDDKLEQLAKGDAAKMERLNALAWKEPKREHKKMMSGVIRYPTLLIFCLRAEPKIKFTKDAQGKTQIVDAGYLPICEKMFMYEMLVGALMHADNPGVPVHIKKLEPELEAIFVAGQQIDEGTGERLASWAKGAKKDVAYITASQHADLVALLSDIPDGESRLKRQAKVERLTLLPAAEYARAVKWAENAARESK